MAAVLSLWLCISFFAPFVSAQSGAADEERLAASLPETTTKPLEGVTAMDEKVTLESEMLAYEAMGEAARRIAAVLGGTKGLTALVVYTQDQPELLAAYRVFSGQLAFLEAKYGEALPDRMAILPVLPEVFALPQALIGSVIDLLALFRTDTTIHGLSFTMEEVALVSQIARELQASGSAISVVYSNLMLPDACSAGTSVLSELARRLNALSLQKAKCEGVIAQMENQENRDEGTVRRLKALNAQYDALLQSLEKYKEATGLSPLVKLAKGACIEHWLDDDGSSILFLKVLRAGGGNRVSRNLFTGSKVQYCGGVILSYILIDKDGAVKRSDTIRCFSDFKKGNVMTGPGWQAGNRQPTE
jgi:hypothetical protein